MGEGLACGGDQVGSMGGSLAVSWFSMISVDVYDSMKPSFTGEVRTLYFLWLDIGL